MANKQYLDSAGVTQMWNACKDKFASKGTFPTIPQFKGTFDLQKPDGMTAIVNEYYGKCENGVLSVMANLVIEFTKADIIDYIAYDYGFYNKFKFSDISPYLVDVYGTRLNTNPTNDGVLVASQRFVAFPSDATSSVGRNETVNLVMATGGGKLQKHRTAHHGVFAIVQRRRRKGYGVPRDTFRSALGVGHANGDENTLQYGVNCILYRRGISANSINMGLINFGGLKVNPGAHLYVQAQVIIPLE